MASHRNWIGLDYDGTINDSHERHSLVLQHVCPQIVEIADWKNRLIQAKREGKSTRAFLVANHVDCADELAAAWTATIEEPKFLAADRPYPGAIESLRKLRSVYSVVLCSARKSETSLLGQLQQHDLTALFDRVRVVAPGRGSGQRKGTATSDAELAAIIGDTESDWEWAQAAQATFVPVEWGFRSCDFWRARQLDSKPTWDAVFSTLGIT